MLTAILCYHCRGQQSTLLHSHCLYQQEPAASKQTSMVKYCYGSSYLPGLCSQAAQLHWNHGDVSDKINGVAIVFVDFETDVVTVVEGDAEEVVEVDLLVPLGDLVDVVGHDQARQHASSKTENLFSGQFH